ncbi:MAG: class B sortase, partial [Oscillospiraceae bacterium]|nr:class B sortase [Oscillospiraceae bacterium]
PPVSEPIQIELAESTVTSTTTTAVTTTTKPRPPADPRVDEAYQINDDVIGWITIMGDDDTPIVDEELLQSEDNAFYLSRDINKEYLFAGSIYSDYRDDFGYVESVHTKQMVIYGHNMLNGTKFGLLKYYRYGDLTGESSYVDEHPIITISNKYHTYNYVIFAGINTREEGEDDVYYWRVHDFPTENDFSTYYDWIIERNLLKDTKTAKAVDVKYGDYIVALSTCANEGYRWVIYARRLRDDETIDMYLPSEETVTTTTNTE